MRKGSRRKPKPDTNVVSETCIWCDQPHVFKVGWAENRLCLDCLMAVVKGDRHLAF